MLIPDGKALQGGTSPFLARTSQKPSTFVSKNRSQQLEYAWQTSWGATTRLVGAVIMTHGDDSGLILPPRVAPIQAVNRADQPG
jgi:prolyl-tRNA synthetase